jgi:hypothetical protein
MLQALAKGKATPQEMAELAKKKLRNKIPELKLALEGKVEEHHRFLLQLQLDRLKAVEEDLVMLEQRIQQKLEPFAAQLASLDEIPGVDWTLAAVIGAPRLFAGLGNAFGTQIRTQFAQQQSTFRSAGGSGAFRQSADRSISVAHVAREFLHTTGTQDYPTMHLSGRDGNVLPHFPQRVSQD